MGFLPLVSFCVYLFALSVVYRYVKKLFSKEPPGPVGFPLVKDLLTFIPSIINVSSIQENYYFHKFLDILNPRPAYIISHELARKYGPILKVEVPYNRAVLISNWELAREAFLHEDLCDRYSQKWFEESRSFGKPLGLIFTNGFTYKHLKAFTNRSLKNYGFGKSQSMQAGIDKELEIFLQHFEKVITESNVLNMSKLFSLPVLNILWTMMARKRFSYDDGNLHQLFDNVTTLVKSLDIGSNLVSLFPFLRKIAPELSGYNDNKRDWKKIQDFIRCVIEERMNQEDTDNSDFIDLFIQEIKKGTLPEVYSEEQFILVCVDLFMAGSETTANSVNFAILYMILNPQVQEKVQQEIDEVIGRDRLPNISDKSKLRYVEATILEIQRLSDVIPLVHRIARRNCTLGNYEIKKDDIVLVNVHSVHRDINIWEDPDSFKPERFSNENGDFVSPSKYFLPFGLGKRVCMGERLARHTLFMMFTSLLQRYKFEASPYHEHPKLTSEKGFTLRPKPYHVLITPRK